MGAKNGKSTFAISSNGDATFSGTLSAPNGTLGSITAGNINGVTIKGSQIIGTTVKTAERGPRVELRHTHLLSYGSGQNPTFSTSERGIRMGYGNSDIAADIYVSRISSKY